MVAPLSRANRRLAGQLRCPHCMQRKRRRCTLTRPKRVPMTPSRWSFQPTRRWPALGAGPVLIFPLPDSLFHGLAHHLMPCLLNLFFHFLNARACFDFDGERYCYLHERNLLVWWNSFSFLFTRGVSLFLATLPFGQNPRKVDIFGPD